MEICGYSLQKYCPRFNFQYRKWKISPCFHPNKRISSNYTLLPPNYGAWEELDCRTLLSYLNLLKALPLEKYYKHYVLQFIKKFIKNLCGSSLWGQTGFHSNLRQKTSCWRATVAPVQKRLLLKQSRHCCPGIGNDPHLNPFLSRKWEQSNLEKEKNKTNIIEHYILCTK